MTTKTIKTILFVSLIAAMIIPISGINNVEAKKIDKEETKQDLKNDVKKWLKDESATKDVKSKSSELKTKFDKLLRDSLEEVRVQTNTRELSEEEIQAAMEYVITETIKDEKIKLLQNSQNFETLNVSDLDAFGIQFADATCPTTTNPSYKQVSIDINGGSYGGYSFNGDNDLYLVTYSDNSSTCERTYVLYWYDEDHPYLDSYYDGLRQLWYGRTYDIESFIIKNNNTIEFDDSWSSTNDYDCLSLSIVGCHETTTKSYSGGTVYVSNTWNHMLDTSDTNPSLSKVTVP